MKKSNYVHALLWVPAVVGSFYLETFWYAKIRYIREVSFFDYRLTIIAVSMLIFTISMLLIYKIQERKSKKNMSKEKQIEEMADDICRIEIEGEHEGTFTCINYNQATTLACELVAQGWKKQSEGEWIARHHMSRSSRGRYTSYNTYICGVCRKANGRRKTPFCPHCGAKMKGGAE